MTDAIDMVRWALLAALLCAATVADVRARRIPNVLTLAGCLAGLAIGAIDAGTHGFLLAGEGLLLAFALTLPLWLAGWFGAGDVKLVSAVGAFTGIGLVVPVLLAIGLAGGLLAAATLLWHGLLVRTGERLTATLGLTLATQRLAYVAPDAQERNVRLPYAIAISAGTLVAVLLFG